MKYALFLINKFFFCDEYQSWTSAYVVFPYNYKYSCHKPKQRVDVFNTKITSVIVQQHNCALFN